MRGLAVIPRGSLALRQGESTAIAMSDPRPREALSAREVAVLLGCHMNSVYSWTKAGKIPGSFRAGRNFRYQADVFQAWVDAGGFDSPNGSNGGSSNGGSDAPASGS